MFFFYRFCDTLLEDFLVLLKCVGPSKPYFIYLSCRSNDLSKNANSPLGTSAIYYVYFYRRNVNIYFFRRNGPSGFEKDFSQNSWKQEIYYYYFIQTFIEKSFPFGENFNTCIRGKRE